MSSGIRELALAAALICGLSGCGSSWGLLVTVRCESPCDLIPGEDFTDLTIDLGHDDPSVRQLLSVFEIGAADTFPISLAVEAGTNMKEGEVDAYAEVRFGGQSGTVVGTGRGSGPMVEGQQTEIVIYLADP